MVSFGDVFALSVLSQMSLKDEDGSVVKSEEDLDVQLQVFAGFCGPDGSF